MNCPGSRVKLGQGVLRGATQNEVRRRWSRNACPALFHFSVDVSAPTWGFLPSLVPETGRSCG